MPRLIWAKMGAFFHLATVPGYRSSAQFVADQWYIDGPLVVITGRVSASGYVAASGCVAAAGYEAGTRYAAASVDM